MRRGWLATKTWARTGCLLAAAAAVEAQEPRALLPAGASHVVVPQASAFVLAPGREGVRIDGVRAQVRVVEQAAATTLEVTLSNPSSRQAEAVLVLPVPPHAAVHGFDFDGAAAEPTAELLPREEARRIYDEIVGRLRDPALLEFAGFDAVRSSLFPVPAGGTQTIRLSYEHLCERSGERVDYVLPRSESLEVRVPWQIEVEISASYPIAGVYSPSHALETITHGGNRVELRTKASAAADPGAFLLSWLLQRGELSASLLAYPDPISGGGHFLLLASLPASRGELARKVRREVTIVIDRSGSMAGEKMEQARAAALQVLEALDQGESFNIVDYSTAVSAFSPRPVVKDEGSTSQARRYIAGLQALGGTNIHDALLEVLLPEPAEGTLPIVLFLTDGLPTIGTTSEVGIREMVERVNAHERRIFTFGVGHDVNVPLLDRLAATTRASSAYVLPNQDVELEVAAVFERLYGPVLSGLELETLEADGSVTTRAVADLHPDRLPDLFEGDQLVLLGRHLGPGPLRFRLRGDFFGTPRAFRFDFDLSDASTRNAFVPRLWASRRIAWLIDRIRQSGAGSLEPGVDMVANPWTDPAFKEIVEEILALSTRYGILTEYTSFLVREGSDLRDWAGLASACAENLDRLAVRERAGTAAVNQGLNLGAQLGQTTLNYANCMWQGARERVEVAGVQQICDRAFFRRGGQWIDSALITEQGDLAPSEVAELGSPEHCLLLERLVREGRAGLLALRGETLLELDGRRLLIRNQH